MIFRMDFRLKNFISGENFAVKNCQNFAVDALITIKN